MRVSDVMSKQVDFVSTNTSVKNVCHLIFGRNINGVPVCKEKKVVGFITDRDILAKFYPSMQDYMEDPVHSSDFEGMEKKISEIFALTADKIMSKNPKVVTSDTPLLKAQSLMLVEKVGRLPVVDKKGILIGIISKGDIFKNVVGQSLSLQEEEGFYDWLAKRYDIMINWKTRLSKEIPNLESLFKKEKVKKVLDVLSSTGEHSITLAKRGFEAYGIESSSLMDKIAQIKKSKLPKEIQNRLKLFQGKYDEILKKIETPIDAAIFMGNALPHVQLTDNNILKKVVSVLRKKNSVMVFQIINFEKVFKVKDRLRDFTIRDERGSYYKSHAFLGFYTKKDKHTLIYTRAIFSSTGEGRWSFITTNSTPIVRIDMKYIESLLRKLGFSEISFYGGMLLGELFKYPFDPLQSDYLNVVAKR